MNDQEDLRIIDLYWQRDEQAITATDKKYGRYCRRISHAVLTQDADVEECLNDTYLKTWQTIPPQRPQLLRTYIGKLCRHTAINLYEKLHALKRGGSQFNLCLDELSEVLTSSSDVSDEVNTALLKETINRFLAELDKQQRIYFIERYWYMLPIKEIASRHLVTQSRIKMSLLRTRQKLQDYLREEGYQI